MGKRKGWRFLESLLPYLFTSSPTDNLCENVVRLQATVDLLQHLSLAIVVDHGFSLFSKHSQALADRFGVVVRSNEQRAVALIAKPFALRRLVDFVIDLTALRTTAAPGKTANHKFVGCVDPHHFVEMHFHLFEHLVECAGLAHGAGKSVEYEAALADFVGTDPLGHHLDRHAVGDQFAMLDVALSESPKICFGFDLGTENHPGRQGFESKPVLK